MADTVEDRVAYIRKFKAHCDKYLAPLADPKEKRVLVIGCGWGSEMFWAAHRGAKEVIGLDLADRNLEPLLKAMAEDKIDIPVEIIRRNVIDFGSPPFDMVISNNVFEHVFALKATLRSLRKLLKPKAPIAIFADPLYYSSTGHHAPLQEWEHLWNDASNFEHDLNEHTLRQFKHGLNEMTVTDFLGAVREAGLVLDHFSIVPDRNAKMLEKILPSLRHRAQPMDLGIEGISAVMHFPD